MSRIQSIARAGALLDAMADGDWHSLRVLAAATGLAKTTTFNLVNALASTGLAEHNQDGGSYRLGLKQVEYGRAVERRLDLLEPLRPVLVELCAETNETVNLAVPRALDVLIVESLEGQQNVRVTSYAGTRASYHCTAAGRAILAHKSPAERRALLAMPLKAPTPQTVTDPAAIEAILTVARRDGYAFECEENEVEACCVAAPILAADGGVLGAISVAGPVGRMNRAKIARFGELLCRRLATTIAVKGT
jgi:IclR family acetate operon transcriptional repressor